MTTLIDKLSSLIQPILNDHDAELVRVKFSGNHILQIMIENADGTACAVGDYQKFSREISTMLDVEDLIDAQYSLEVGSPGIDRPLTRLKDFANHIGFEAKLELITPIERQKKFRGNIQNVTDETISFVDSGVEISFTIDNVKDAKLILTDELIKAKQPPKKIDHQD